MISETQRARKIIPHQLDISYGTSDKQTYDLYGTDLPDEAMFVFWIHGGYWQGSINPLTPIKFRLHKKLASLLSFQSGCRGE